MMRRRTVIHWRGGVPVKSYYEAGKKSPLQKQRRETGSGDTAVLRAGASIREQARHLDQNHDIAKGALNTLVQNVVGPNGIMIEPQPRRRDGSIHDAFAKQILREYLNWCERPEVTWQHDWASAQRISARSWLRDGECLGQHVAGLSPAIDHGTRVPYSIELLEADQLPLTLNENGDRRIVQGVELNGWNRPVAYHLLKQHPGDFRLYSTSAETKRALADRIMHVKLIERIGQTRGVSVFAPIMLRLDDLKDYEESERIAAKVAASMAAFIRKGSPEQYSVDPDEDGADIPRDIRFRPGMVFDNLREGESIEVIDTKRPSTQLEPYRNGQLRAGASGIYLSYSAFSKDYNGTYSAQRQELVEGYGAYGILASEFIGQFVRPAYHKFLEMAFLSHLVVPADVDPLSLGDAFYMPPQMPWIDPVKESVAWGNLEENGHASGIEIVRRRGLNPQDVVDQQKRWKQMKGEGETRTDQTAEPNARARAWDLINNERN